MSERYIVHCSEGPVVRCVTERQALQNAALLLDKYGPGAEIEIYLNELSNSSLLYSKEWMRQWNETRLRRN